MIGSRAWVLITWRHLIPFTYSKGNSCIWQLTVIVPWPGLRQVIMRKCQEISFIFCKSHRRAILLYKWDLRIIISGTRVEITTVWWTTIMVRIYFSWWWSLLSNVVQRVIVAWARHLVTFPWTISPTHRILNLLRLNRNYLGAVWSHIWDVVVARAWEWSRVSAYCIRSFKLAEFVA